MVGNLLKNKKIIILSIISIIIFLLVNSCSIMPLTDEYQFNNFYSVSEKKKKRVIIPLTKIVVTPQNALLKEGASMILSCYGRDRKGRKLHISPTWIVETPEVGYVKPRRGRRVIFYSKSKGVAFIKVKKGKVFTTVIIEVK